MRQLSIDVHLVVFLYCFLVKFADWNFILAHKDKTLYPATDFTIGLSDHVLWDHVGDLTLFMEFGFGVFKI